MKTRRILITTTLVLFFLITVTASESTRKISVDLNNVRGERSLTSDFCVGAGRANEGLRADWQRQLAEVKKACGFRYLRFHGLLCDDMGVYREDREGNPVYNWQYIDELFDAMLDMGIRPFVELGFMPSALASGPETIFWWKGNVTPPDDPAKWEDLIRNLVAHWTDRYGEEEVLQWYFEVWNEPNLSGFWIGNTKGMSSEEFEVYAKEEYFKLFATTFRAVKSVNAKYRVGGPATAGNAWIPEMIDYCDRNDLPIDFVSTHNYSVVSGYLDESGYAGTVFNPARDAMIRDVKGVRAEIAVSAMPDLELHYTEWSSSYTPSDPIHDSYHSASFILNKLKGIGRAAQSMSYWTFTDIFEEAGPRVTPFHGGFGMINYQGIRKSSFYAYQFLNRLGAYELEGDDEDSWVCTDGAGNVQALFWDFTITHPGPEIINQEYYHQDLPAERTRSVQLAIRNLEPGSYRLTVYKIGYRANDAYTAYLDMGAPQQLSKMQVAALNAMSSGAPEFESIVQVADNGTYESLFPMCQNDVILVLMQKL